MASLESDDTRWERFKREILSKLRPGLPCCIDIDELIELGWEEEYIKCLFGSSGYRDGLFFIPTLYCFPGGVSNTDTFEDMTQYLKKYINEHASMSTNYFRKKYNYLPCEITTEEFFATFPQLAIFEISLGNIYIKKYACVGKCSYVKIA